MADFKTHAITSAISSSMASSAFFSLHILTPEQAVISFLIGSIGGFLPDIDSSYSFSIKAIFNISFIFVSIILILNMSFTHQIIEIFIYIFIIYILINYFIIDIVRKYLKHRGLHHSIPVAFIWSIMVVIISSLLFNCSYLVSYIYGILMFIGYLTHLILDEIYSVDIKNKKIKKSFGSALKLGMFKNRKQKLQTFLIYIILLSLILMLPKLNTVYYLYSIIK